MNSTPTILFLVLTGWAQMTSSADDFKSLLTRLESLPDFETLLSFKFKDKVIQDLKETSKDFKKLYVKHHSKLKPTEGNYAPIAALTQTIADTFKGYKKETKQNGDMLGKIRKMDPIGLVVYLTELSHNKSSAEIDESIAEFYKTMYDRMKLLQNIQDLSFIEVFRFRNKVGVLHEVPDKIRREIASEGTVLSHDCINHFIDIVKKEKPKFHMYYDFDFQMRNFTAFKSKDPNAIDIQILFGGEGGNDNIGHWICIQYRADTRKVYVYDSLYRNSVDEVQQEIILSLYPFMEGDMVFVEPKYLQSDATSCGIHSIFYATTMLLGKDPNAVKVKINNVRGDQSLYMRLHVLKIFANRNLALFAKKPCTLFFL